MHSLMHTYTRTYTHARMLTHINTHTMFTINAVPPRTCQQYYIEVSSWMIRMESALKHDKESSTVRSRGNLFISGLLSAYKISHLVKTILNYHGHVRQPLTKSVVLHLCKLLELLKVPNMITPKLTYTWFISCSLSSSLFTVAHLHSPTTLIMLFRPYRLTSSVE